MIEKYTEPSGFIPISSIQWDSSWPELAEENDRQHLFSYMERRFGISEGVFDAYLLFKKQRSWWLLRDSPFLRSTSRLKVARAGLRAFQRIGKFVKPSTRMIQVFGSLATKARVEIDEVQLETLLNGEPLHIELEIEDGYVILLFAGHILGLGLFIGGKILPQFPRNELTFSLKGKQ
jgi:NOL1/NOP2/fmu family ribosome biogenesis protein